MLFTDWKSLKEVEIAISTSFKDFQSVNSKVTYIPWLDFEPTLEGWRVLVKSPARGGVDIVEPYFNSLFVTCTASLISIVLGTLAAAKVPKTILIKLAVHVTKRLLK